MGTYAAPDVCPSTATTARPDARHERHAGSASLQQSGGTAHSKPKFVSISGTIPAAIAPNSSAANAATESAAAAGIVRPALRPSPRTESTAVTTTAYDAAGRIGE